MVRVACIDGDADLRRILQIVLIDAGFEAVQWPGAMGAQAFLRRERPDVLLLEMRLDGEYAGLRVLEQLRDHPETAGIAVIVCSGDIRFVRAHDRALRARDCAVLEKPFTAEQFLGAVRHATDAIRFRRAPRPELSRPPRRRCRVR